MSTLTATIKRGPNPVPNPQPAAIEKPAAKNMPRCQYWRSPCRGRLRPVKISYATIACPTSNTAAVMKAAIIRSKRATVGINALSKPKLFAFSEYQDRKSVVQGKRVDLGG